MAMMSLRWDESVIVANYELYTQRERAQPQNQSLLNSVIEKEEL
jgi:hypothetical protein